MGDMPVMSDHGYGPEPTCPECGDQAFYVDLDDECGFSCDSCDYIVTSDGRPEVKEFAKAWNSLAEGANKSESPDGGR